MNRSFKLVAVLKEFLARYPRHLEHIRLTKAPFAGIEGIHQMAVGERRFTVLIELLSKQVRLRVAPANLRKVG